MGLGSHIAVAVAVAGRGSSDLTPSLGTSICCRRGPKKKKKKKDKLLVPSPSQYMYDSGQRTDYYNKNSLGKQKNGRHSGVTGCSYE